MKYFGLKNLLVMILLLIFISPVTSGCSLLEIDDPDSLNLIKVKITSVVDGDTARARFPDGSEERVRFIGVDAPEINDPVKGVEPFGPEAEVYARSHLAGKTLWLEFDVAERDQYGRILAYLWLSIPGEINDREIREKMFNARLLIEGYAVQVIFPPNVKYVDYFYTYAAEARDNNRGLWGIEEDIQ